MKNSSEIIVEAITKYYNIPQRICVLDEISFSLNKGDVLGIMGSNGSGKSTLLKIICGLTKPDKGRIKYWGKLTYILDVGSSFHPDLSGRENVFLVGRINGFSDAEIKEKIESIIEFSEIGRFIDVPLKYYSNGMYLRLAFTTNTSFHSDIVVLDEIMSVGDLGFQKKAKERIRNIVSSGATVIMTGHDIEELSALCTKGLWLDSGKQIYFGEINQVIDKYLTCNGIAGLNSGLSFLESEQREVAVSSLSSETIANIVSGDVNQSDKTNHLSAYSQHIVFQETILDVVEINLIEIGIKPTGRLYHEVLEMKDELEINVRYAKRNTVPVVLFVVLQDRFGHNLMSLCSHRVANEAHFIDNTEAGVYSYTVLLPANFFNQGVFSISLFFVDENENDIAKYERILFFKILPSEYTFRTFTYKGNFPGTLLPVFQWHSTRES